MNITNFRDLGGYKTSDGLRVKNGFFYRSGPITFQTDADREAFSKLHMKTILDLRSIQEMEELPDETVDGCHYIHCSAIAMDVENAGNFDMAALMQSENLKQLALYVEKTYKALPFQNEAYQILFDLMKKDETPLVFHCSAGKDRTGFAAYLILKTLGVPDGTILHDYMLSNVYRKSENEKILALAGHLKDAEALLYVKESYLQSSMDAIAQKYENFETYLEKEYGITSDDVLIFRNRYLTSDAENI